MADRCSILSYDELKASGQLGKAQAMYLHVFATAEGMPIYFEPGSLNYVRPLGSLTHREATKRVEEIFGKKMPARNGRIAELEERGFLMKVGTTIDNWSKKTVNLWIWTGRTTPFEAREEWTPCAHCEGKGGRVVKKYVAPPATIQPDLFSGK